MMPRHQWILCLLAVILLGQRGLGARRRNDVDTMDDDDDDADEDDRGMRVVAQEVVKEGEEAVEGPVLPGTLSSLGLLAGKGLSVSKLWKYGRAYTGSRAGERAFQGEVSGGGGVGSAGVCGQCVLVLVLGYVTPWNRGGYQVSETFARKFSYVSPVWYQVREEGGKIVLTGGHEVDADWLARVRKNSSSSPASASCAATGEEGSSSCPNYRGGKCVRRRATPPPTHTHTGDGDDDEDDDEAIGVVAIVPRVIWELQSALRESDVPKVVRLLQAEAEKHGLDGYTLEMPIIKATVTLASKLRAALGGDRATLVVAIPSYQMPTGRTPKEYHVTTELLSALSKSVDRFSVMCYDYQRTQTGIPMAPIAWVRSSIMSLATDPQVRRKLLLGLPFYGYQGGQPILSNTLMDVVKKFRVTTSWDEESKEHVFTYREPGARVDQRLTYPTPLFLKVRLDLARELGVAGVAIWEVGQGLNAFMELF